MDTKIKMNVIPDSQIQINGFSALKKDLGVVDTIRFLEFFDKGGSGDYTKEKYEQKDSSPTKEDLMKSFNLV